jgi:anti-sigma factor RsiW
VTCKEFILFLMVYLESSLPSAKRQEFDEHLAECPECREYMESYKLTGKLSRSAMCDNQDVPAEVPKRLVDAIIKSRARS